MPDTRYLIRRGNIYWLQLASPRPLHGRTKRVVQRTLGTSKLSEAQAARWSWVHGYKHAWKLADADPDMTAKEIEAAAEAEQARLWAIETGTLGE